MSYNVLINLVTEDDAPCNDETVFNGVIGQVNVLKKLDFYVKAHRHSMKVPSLLFTGSHGLGKTYIAERLAENLHRRFSVINASSVVKAQEFIEGAVFSSICGDKPVTILIDEAHSLTKEVTTVLLSILNPNSSNINIVEHKGIGISFDLNKINFIFATTDAHLMFQPLKNRCETVYFEPYATSETLDLLKFYVPTLKLSCDQEDIAMACRGRARDSFLLANNLKRYCAVNSRNEITQNDWNEIKKIFDIKPMGLNSTDYSVLKHINNNGPISCANLAYKFMVNEDNMRYEIEPRLHELNFIENTPRGRVVTEKGKRYIEEFGI